MKDGPAGLLGNQRGVAVPLALITLLVLASLLLELSAMSATEPSIAANQLRSTQARPSGIRAGPSRPAARLDPAPV